MVVILASTGDTYGLNDVNPSDNNYEVVFISETLNLISTGDVLCLNAVRTNVNR